MEHAKSHAAMRFIIQFMNILWVSLKTYNFLLFFIYIKCRELNDARITLFKSLLIIQYGKRIEINFNHVLKNILFTFIILFIQSHVYGQVNNNYKRTINIVVNIPMDTIITWNESILPGSISWIQNEKPIDVIFIFTENKIIPDWSASGLDSGQISLKFDALPYSFHERITLWDTSQIRVVEGDIFYNPIEVKPSTALIESTGLEYDGALTRGFSLGNNQSLVFDSELNLQLGGNIGDGYEIKAAITDNNLPIQPDGTTRQIQEFDKVYIEIKKEQHSILAGDFDALHPPGYFMRYNRKLKGAQYSFAGNNYNSPWNIKGSAAVSRGKFTRQIIIPTEGNQGPYPLRGENGELFIIVLAGSEKVFIDGQLLTRGEDADYIMDYNQSEIAFTRNILINARHRITVEFEYAQFNFQKSHNALDINYQKNNLSSYIHFFQENDSKSVTGDLELTAEDLNLLSMAGDEGDEFFKTGIREAPESFNTNTILYAAIDTTVDGIMYKDVLLWSNDPEQANLIVSFSEVGVGKGDYIISPDPTPNGRVYRWVAPDPVSGQKNGNFAPVIPLQAPQQKQMLTAGGEYHWGDEGRIMAEIGLSRHDLNRYSEIDDHNNTGLAIKINAIHTIPIGKVWKFAPFIGYESSGVDFRPLDPYRNPEFARDWNITPGELQTNEHLPTLGFNFGRSERLRSQYKYEGLFRPGFYNGNRHTGTIQIDTSGWKFEAIIGVMDARDQSNKTSFIRPVISLEKIILQKGSWRLGGRYFEDRNEVRDRIADTLRMPSFIENKTSLYIRNDPGANTYFYLEYIRERPQLAIENQFSITEKVSEWRAGGHLHQWKDFKMEYVIKHRDVDPLLAPAQGRTRNLLGRLDTRADLWKKSFKWSSGYEIGNGQEPKTEYKYIKVQKGEGLYVWVDNGNGIEELNEFELAPFADQGEYIRLSVFNNDFIRTRTLGLQQTLNIDLKNIQSQGILSKIAMLSTYQLSRKIREDMDSPYWNPFYANYPDTSIIAYSGLLRNILYWNRSSTVYDIQLGYIHQENQVLQTSGYEIRDATDLTLRFRLSLLKKMDIVLNARKGRKENRSQFFDECNFILEQAEVGPELNMIIKDKLRLTGSYQFLVQDNSLGQEEFNSHKLTFEGVWRKSNTMDFRAQISLVNIEYISFGNMNVDFAILQGLQNGGNVLWTAQFNTRLNKSLILTLQYNGRNTGDVKTIHTGTAQVRANF